MDERFVEELRERLPEYLRMRYGVDVESRKRFHCLSPQHQDKNPSMGYDKRRGKVHCFSCQADYDLFDLIGIDYPECTTFPQKVEKACWFFRMDFPANGANNTYLKREKKVPNPEPQDHTQQVETELSQVGAGGPYFESRGVSLETCQKYHLYEKDGRAWLPVYQQGRCVSRCGRAIDSGDPCRYLNSPGPMGIFNGDYLLEEGQGAPLFVTEAIFDALSVEECGYRAVALCGVSNIRKFLELCREHPDAANSYTIIGAGDGDPAGQRMNEQLAQGLKELGIACQSLTLPEGVKDLNQLLVGDRRGLEDCLRQAAEADARAYALTSAGAQVDILLDLSAKGGSRQAISTGFQKLDSWLDGGLYTGLYVLGAISSVGKSSFLLQMGDWISKEWDVLYFSLEMGKEELMAKSISRLSFLLDQQAGRPNALSLRQVFRMDAPADSPRGQLLAKAVETYRSQAGRLFIREGMADIGAREIRDAVREHIRLRGRKPVVLVDYLQILKPEDPRATDKQNTDRAVVELKRISRDFDLPVFALSSFNRESYRGPVTMEAFKESGAVEYSADVLLGIQMAGAGEKGFDLDAAKRQERRAVELVLLKNRNGAPSAKILMEYRAKYHLFQER